MNTTTPEKRIQDYLNLYSGQDVLIINPIINRIANPGIRQKILCHMPSEGDKGTLFTVKDATSNHSHNLNKVMAKLLLIPLRASYITDDDAKKAITILLGTADQPFEKWDDDSKTRWFPHIKHEITDDLGSTMQIAGFKTTFRLTRFLLSKGYDLYDLIPAGIAIDKTTYKL